MARFTVVRRQMRMRTDLTQRNEMYRARFLKDIAILLSSLPWVFIASVVLFWGQIDDHAPLFIIAAIVCLLCSSIAILLFIGSRGDSDATRSDALWILWAALPILLIPLVACWYVLYGLGYFSTHLAGMHDSM